MPEASQLNAKISAHMKNKDAERKKEYVPEEFNSLTPNRKFCQCSSTGKNSHSRSITEIRIVAQNVVKSGGAIRRIAQELQKLRQTMPALE